MVSELEMNVNRYLEKMGFDFVYLVKEWWAYGWGEKHIRQYMQFAETFPDELIVAALRRQLEWSHFKYQTHKSLFNDLVEKDGIRIYG